MLAFLAHPVRGNVPQNLRWARGWYRRLTDNVPGVDFVAHWIIDCEVYDDAVEAERKAGIERNLRMIERCDALVLCGHEVTSGMQQELRHAMNSSVPFLDLTSVCDWLDEAHDFFARLQTIDEVLLG